MPKFLLFFELASRCLQAHGERDKEREVIQTKRDVERASTPDAQG